MRSYRVLKQQEFENGDYSLVPIRAQDRYDIMKWRNEQQYHLRQDRPLTKEDQDRYFSVVVDELFEKERPDQILFSYLLNDRCIGYGGLVHINWADKNAEISFITDTSIKNEQYAFHMSTFLQMLEQVAFRELSLHKVFTYAFDLRPEIYPILERNGFRKEAVLAEHCHFNGNFVDVIIHTKFC